jgi:hypothetical protein
VIGFPAQALANGRARHRGSRCASRRLSGNTTMAEIIAEEKSLTA